MSSNGWTAAGCGAHVCSLERQRITATRNWQPARWKTHHFWEGTDLLNYHQLAVIRIHPEVVGFLQPLTPFPSIFFFNPTHPFWGDLPCSSLQRADDSLTGSASCWKTKHSRYFGTGSVATGHEFGGTDGYMVDHARGAGIAEEDHFGSWSVSPEFPERWGGLMQAVGATQPGLHGESKDIKTPPSPPSPKAHNQPPAPSARLCAAGPWKPTRFVVWLLFLPTGPWGDFLL